MKESRIAGRAAVYVPEHPKANNRGYVLKSRWILEQKLGRYLSESEEVHHKDENDQNDEPSNLEIKTTAQHAKHHWPSKVHLMNGPADRKLDYEHIQVLMGQGFGYRRIAKLIGEPLYSVKYATRRIKLLGP